MRVAPVKLRNPELKRTEPRFTAQELQVGENWRTTPWKIPTETSETFSNCSRKN